MAASRVAGGVTDQRWERPFVHGGNTYPSTGRSVDAMLGWSLQLARWLQGRGYHVSRLREGRCGMVLLGGSRDEVLRGYGELQTWCRRMKGTESR